MNEREPMSILLVEDNGGDARLVEEMLGEKFDDEFDLTRVESLVDALGEMRRSSAACVLLDLRLPDANWLESLVALGERFPEVPVVILSGLEEESLAVEAVQEGAEDYLIKSKVDGVLLARSIKYAVERRRVAERLAHFALHDPLTGLASRVLFMDRVAHTLARLARQRSLIAVLQLGMDRFEEINDRFGHAAGDIVLAELAGRMERCVRGSDTVARLGGDRFAILFEDIREERMLARAVSRLRQALRRPIALGVTSTSVPFSIGAVVTSLSAATPEALMRDAELAMRQAKENGGYQLGLARTDSAVV